MATTVQVELQAKTDKAIKEIESLQQEIKNLSKQVEDGNKKTAETLKDVEKSSSGAAKGIGKIGDSLKTGLIFLYVEAFTKLREVFNENQKVADAFNTVFETLSLAFNDFFNFLDRNIGTVTGYFKSIFSDPTQAITDFGDAIKQGLIDRFNQALEVLGLVGKAFGELVKGEFSAAFDTIKEAGKETVDVITGVDDSFDKTVETVKNVSGSIVNYAKSTIDAAKSNVELQKQAELSRARQQGILEDFDLQAEKLRQVRDEERNTIEDRIKANDELARVLDEQEKQMLKMVDIQIRAAQLEFDKNQNLENELALTEALNEKRAVEAQIAGFRSEQKSNDLALDREKIELEQTITDATLERLKSENEFQAEQIENDLARVTFKEQALEKEKEMELQLLIEKRNLYKQGTQAYQDAENERLAFVQEIDQKEKEMNKLKFQAIQNEVIGALSSLVSIVGENSKFGKALSVSQAIIDTIAGANVAIKSAPPPFNFIQAAAVTAAGFANVKKILATKLPSPPSFATKGTGGAEAVASIPAPSPAPAFNIVGASGINQLAEVVGQQATQPVKAFVVSKDVTTSQELDRNIVKGASL